MYRFQRFSRGLAAVAVLALPLTATAAFAQTAPLSYAVPDAGAWSDVLKNSSKSSASPARKAERKKAAPAQRQAKARPAKSEAREAFASEPPKQKVSTTDVKVVSPDELNEIDQQAQ